MLTQKLIAQDVMEEIRGFLTQAGINELDFLKHCQADHHLLANLRKGESIRTGTIDKLFKGILSFDRDWVFRHERRDAVIMRARALRLMHLSEACDELRQAVYQLERWPKT